VPGAASRSGGAGSWRDFCSYHGVVTAIVPFGAFVQIADGVVGLLPGRDRATQLSVGDHGLR